MWRGDPGSDALAAARAGGIVIAVLTLALFSSAVALLITSDDGLPPAVARLIPAAERFVSASPALDGPAALPVAAERVEAQAAARPPLIAPQPPPRPRPDGEREAVTRVVPAARDVHQLGLALSIAESDPPPLTAGTRILAEVTFYYCQYSDGTPGGDGGLFCELMRDGTAVYPGAAACHYNYLGQRFTIAGDPSGRVYTCNDTGSAILGQHRDIWFMTSAEGWAWQQVVGPYAVISIVDEADDY